MFDYPTPVNHRYLAKLLERRWRQGGGAADGPSLAAAELRFTRLLFPLLQAVLGMGSHPAIRQQSFQGNRVARGNGRNPSQHFR